MKVRTVAVLAALGMLLTSVSVWSLTKPRPASWSDPGAAAEGPAALVAAASEGLAAFSLGDAIRFEGRVGHPALLADRPGETLLLAAARADSAAPDRTQPLNLAIVLDRSGSMKGRRLDNAVSAARGMIQRLRDGDVVSVIAYDTETETLLPPTTIDASSRGRATSSLFGVTAKGDTCISCGIDAGMAALRQRSGMVDRILLLSDGEATAGVRDLGGFRRIAENARSMACAISSIGVDVDYNEQVLSVLARESNGRHHFALADGDVFRAFDAELESLVATVARDVEARIALAPGVELVEVVDRVSRRDGNTVRVALGTLAKNEEKTVLVRVRVPKGAVGDRPLAELALSFADADGRRSTIDGKLGARLTTDAGEVRELDPIIAARLAATDTADTLGQVNDLIKAGDFDGARRRLDRKLEEATRNRGALTKAAPRPARAKLEKDLERQEQALEAAKSGLDKAPKPTTAGGQRAGKAEVRSNQVLADPFRL